MEGRDLFSDIKKGNKKGISDFLVIGYPYSENTCNFIYVTSFTLLADHYSDSMDQAIQPVNQFLFFC